MITAILVSLTAMIAQADDGVLVGAWDSPDYKIQFNTDGTYNSWAGNQQVDGQWQAQGGLLQTQTNGMLYQYGYQLAGNQLVLQDQNGAQMGLVRGQGAFTPPQPAAAPAHANTTPFSKREWLAFVEGYQNMSPDEIFWATARLDSGQMNMLSLFDALRSDMVYRACHGSHASQITWDGGCQTVAAQRQQAEMWVAEMGSTLSQHRTEQADLAFGIRCELGLNDKGTCSMKWSMDSNLMQQSHETSMAIIDNMGNKGCTEYYDQTGGYVGCW